jgi:hypothetical protein
MKKTSNIWWASKFVLACITVAPLLAQWLNYPAAKTPLSGPAPKTAQGKPDLSGIWEAEDQTYFFDLAAGLKPDEVIATPWAKALQKQREDNLHADDPLARCLPHGVPRVNTNGLFPFKIIQTPALVVILYEQLGLFRQVFMDGRKLAKDVNPTWLGYSTGRWEGDTLVIDTSGFNGKTWLDTAKGRPASEKLHVVERFRRTGFGSMEVRATIDDPEAYEKPWTTAVQKMHLLQGTEILEFSCNENEKDQPHMPGK